MMGDGKVTYLGRLAKEITSEMITFEQNLNEMGGKIWRQCLEEEQTKAKQLIQRP